MIIAADHSNKTNTNWAPTLKSWLTSSAIRRNVTTEIKIHTNRREKSMPRLKKLLRMGKSMARRILGFSAASCGRRKFKYWWESERNFKMGWITAVKIALTGFRT